MSRLGFRLIDQKDKEIGNKELDRSWQVEDYEDHDDQEAGIEESIAICERAYGSFMAKPHLTRATSVEIQAGNVGTVMSPSPNVDSQSSVSKTTAQSDSWSEVGKKNTLTTPSATRVPLTSRPTCFSTEVKKIMQEAAERAAQVILKDVRKTF